MLKETGVSNIPDFLYEKLKNERRKLEISNIADGFVAHFLCILLLVLGVVSLLCSHGSENVSTEGFSSELRLEPNSI
jgi:hypothetical protein